MIVNQLIQNTTKFDNIFTNKLLAYTAIINSLNYKWYKSSKRRLLLPNFYFTHSFYKFYKNIFLKNIFRKNIQPVVRYSFFNSVGFFEKKMFLKHVYIQDWFKSSNSYFFFLKNKNTSFLKKDRFFFKKSFNFLENNSSVFLSNDIDIDLDVSANISLFKKNVKISHIDYNFNFLIFFFISLSSMVEIYKILILLNFTKINFNFFKKI